jgi:CDP-glucose 4,6-dehydratase
VRSGNAIGGGDFAPRRLLPDCFRSLLARKPFVLTSPGSVRPWQSVLEPASGYLWLGARLLEDPSLAEAWNFGPPAGDSVTCERLTHRLFELWGAAYEPEIRPGVRYQAAALLIDSGKAAERLGWRSVWSWEEALAASVAWFKEYEARGGDEDGGGSANAAMHDVCLKQIADFTAAARARGAPWAR